MIKRCLTIINTKSGAKEGQMVFASALHQLLHGTGITHIPVPVPEKNLVPFIEESTAYDAIAVCGGDGTVSSVINTFAASSQRQALLAKPLILVPCGMQNSIATSLEIVSAETSMLAFVSGRQISVPIWEVVLNQEMTAMRFVVSYVAIGAYANTVRRAHKMEESMDDYWTLPNIRSKFKFAALYTTALAELCDVSIQLEYRTTPQEKLDGKRGEETIRGPIRNFIAAQMPLQHRGYSLTPHASYQHGVLAATIADATAKRSRLWHLFTREATRIDLGILNEDGVREVTDVEALTITVGPSEPCLLMLDGEPMILDPGSVVRVRRMTGGDATFLSP